MRGMVSKTALAVAKAAAAIAWTQSGIVAQSIRLEGAAADSAVDAAVPSHEASIVRPLPAAQPPPPQTPAAAAAPPPPPPLSAVTDAQRQRAEANRLKALERKRERDAAAAATDAAGEQPAKR